MENIFFGSNKLMTNFRSILEVLENSFSRPVFSSTLSGGTVMKHPLIRNCAGLKNLQAGIPIQYQFSSQAKSSRFLYVGYRLLR